MSGSYLLEEIPTDQKHSINSFLLGHFNAILSCLMFNMSGIIVCLLLSPINTDQRHQLLGFHLILPSWSPNQQVQHWKKPVHIEASPLTLFLIGH